MHNNPNVSYFQDIQGLVRRRETGVGYTISLFSYGGFLVPDNLCYGIVFTRIFGVFILICAWGRDLCILRRDFIPLS